MVDSTQIGPSESSDGNDATLSRKGNDSLDLD